MIADGRFTAVSWREWSSEPMVDGVADRREDRGKKMTAHGALDPAPSLRMATPYCRSWGTGVLGARNGCRAVEMTSLDPPKLARTNGKVNVIAEVLSSDSLPDGPGEVLAASISHQRTSGPVCTRLSAACCSNNARSIISQEGSTA